MSSITLTAAVRSNLLALQDTTANQATTQQRLATGKKVNSALDNPTNYFTAAALSARAGQLTNLLDSMTNGINTIKQASNGLDSITTTLQSMQATVTQARQDASWQSASYSVDATAIGTAAVKNLSFSGGAVGVTPVNVALNSVTAAATPASLAGTVAVANDAAAAALAAGTVTFTATNGDTVSANLTATAATTRNAITTALSASGFSASWDASNQLVVTRSDGVNFTASGTAASLTALGISTTPTTNGVPATTGAVKSVDDLVTAINSDTNLTGKVRASNNAGQLQITNLSTASLTVVGASSTAVNGGTGAPATQTIAGNTTRANLVKQFNAAKDQLDKTAADASFNGINLLTGDQLKLYFNENSTSSITIQSTNTAGVNSSTLGITAGADTEFQSNTALDSRLQALQTAVTTVASQASAFGSNLSIVQNRQTFTNNMINTLQTGADGLTLADGNLEGANMLALQTRQQLSIQALSLASQANQAVLRLFG